MKRGALTQITIAVLACSALVACNKREPAEPEPTQEPAAAPSDPHAEHTMAAEPTAEMPEPPAGARVFFASPADGAMLTGPIENGKVTFDVKMGAEAIAIEPAGEVKAGSGHHHVLIDQAAMAKGTVVPKDEQHLHFGKGQTEASLSLAPGAHKLTLQLADGIHRSYGDALSATISVNVAGTGTVAAQVDQEAADTEAEEAEPTAQ